MDGDGKARLVVRQGQTWKSNYSDYTITIKFCNIKHDFCQINIDLDMPFIFGLMSKKAILYSYNLISTGQYPAEKWYI